MMILAPIAALLIQMAISRTREFDADGTAAEYTGGPYGLMSALAETRDMVQAYSHGRVTGHRAHVHHQALYGLPP